MGNISSTVESPYGVLADLLQSKLASFIKDLKHRNINIVVGRPYRKDDPMPSFYVLPNQTQVKQSGIGEQKTLLKHMEVLVMFYTDDVDYDLFITEQFITQIYVVNNKLTDTKQFKSVGQEYMQIGTFDYGYVYSEEVNLEMKHISTNIKVAYQDSYYGVS